MTMAILFQILEVKKRSLIILAILLAVAVLLQLFISLYQEKRVEIAAGEWSKYREEQKLGAALTDRETVYKNGIADLLKFRERIYPKHQFARFLGELYQTAAQDSLDLSGISYKPSLLKEERLLSYAMTLSVSGRYPNLKKFISDLGSSSNILTIDSVSFTYSGAASDSVNLQVLITAYFKVEQ